MPRMKVVGINPWNETGVQVSYRSDPSDKTYGLTYTEQAMPENVAEYTRLIETELHEEYDLTIVKVV